MQGLDCRSSLTCSYIIMNSPTKRLKKVVRHKINDFEVVVNNVKPHYQHQNEKLRLGLMYKTRYNSLNRTQ